MVSIFHLQLIAYFYDFADADALGCASVCDKLVTESFSSFLPLHNSLFHPLTDSSTFCFHRIRSYLQFPSKDFHLSSQVMEDAHSPPRLRVIGTLSNRFSNLKLISSPGFKSQRSYIGTLLMRLEIRILSILNHSQLNCSQPPVFERVLVQRRLEDERGEEMQRLVKH